MSKYSLSISRIQILRIIFALAFRNRAWRLLSALGIFLLLVLLYRAAIGVAPDLIAFIFVMVLALLPLATLGKIPLLLLEEYAGNNTYQFTEKEVTINEEKTVSLDDLMAENIFFANEELVLYIKDQECYLLPRVKELTA